MLQRNCKIEGGVELGSDNVVTLCCIPSECANRTYGRNCEKKCGQCRNEADCDPVSGLCTLGCDPGWQDIKCQQSKEMAVKNNLLLMN